MERLRRKELREAKDPAAISRKERARTLKSLADEYLASYRLRHKAITFAEYAIDHLLKSETLGKKTLSEIGEIEVGKYQDERLREKASPKSINEEIGFLLRIMDEKGDLLRGVLKRKRRLKLPVGARPGKAFSIEQKDALVAAAKRSRSMLILPALTLALNAGMRDGEIKRTQWSQIDFEKAVLTVGKSKTAAGEGRTIPLNSEILGTLEQHAVWYRKKFKQIRPEWYVFPFGKRGLMDPRKPITTLKTAWSNVRESAKVDGRWHDARHTLITELAESGAGDQTIMAIVGHVSRQMVAHYSHIRTEAKRDALEEVVKHRQAARAVSQGKKKTVGSAQR